MNTDACRRDLARVPAALVAYVEAGILPRYAAFDAAHREDHARAVMARSLELLALLREQGDAPLARAEAELTATAEAVVYAAAAYHDLGLRYGRERHHLESARLLLADERLPRWFTPRERRLMADACADHRASAEHAPRTAFGRILAEADRLIVPETVVRRTVQFSLAHYPELTAELHYDRVLGHLREKYGEGGYLRLWIPQSPNAACLDSLRRLIREPERLRTLFDRLMDEEGAAEG